MLNKSFHIKHKVRQGSMGLMVLVFFLALIISIAAANYGYIYYLEDCGDEPFVECFLGSENSDESNPEEKSESLVTATGSITKKDYTANVVMNIPLEGGEVTGTVSGVCKASITGTYSGGDNGSISGTVGGSCSPFYVPVPAKGTFTGTVNQQTKTIPINGQGSAAGFSGSGSLTLTY